MALCQPIAWTVCGCSWIKFSFLLMLPYPLRVIWGIWELGWDLGAKVLSMDQALIRCEGWWSFPLANIAILTICCLFKLLVAYTVCGIFVFLVICEINNSHSRRFPLRQAYFASVSRGGGLAFLPIARSIQSITVWKCALRLIMFDAV